MADRITDVVVLAEDRAQQHLLRSFLTKRGTIRKTVFRDVPEGRGSGEQFVREQLPRELRAMKVRQVAQWLIVVIDADVQSVQRRLDQLLQPLDAQLRELAGTSRVIVLIPKRNVETWGVCLLGHSPNEQTDYRKPGLNREQWTHAGRTLFDWSRPNAVPPDKCVDSLRRCLPTLADIPRTG